MTEATAEATATISDQIDTDTQNPELTGPEARRFLVVTFFLLVYQGFTMAITGIGAPFIAKSFGLSQSGIAALYAWISLSAIGGLLLSRFADRVGRRRVLLICMAGTSLSAMLGALSPTPAIFAFAEILVFTFASATVAISVVMLAEELPVSQRARGQSVGGLGVMIGGGLCLLLMPQVAATAWSWRWASTA